MYMSKSNYYYSSPLLTTLNIPKCSININALWNNKYVPSPEKVILILIKNGYNCSYYKMFDRNTKVLDAIRNVNSKAVIAFNNWELKYILYDENFAFNEINKLITYIDVIDCIAVGNEPLGSWYNNEFTLLLAPAVNKVSNIIKQLMPKQKITVPFNFAIFDNTYPPSNSVILTSVNNIVMDVLLTINNHSVKSPVMVNIYPYLTYQQNSDIIDFNFAIGSNTISYIEDQNYKYSSLFSLMYDSAFVALKKTGLDIDLVIGEVGWPSEGGLDATTENQCKSLYELSLISAIGTPRSNSPIQIYIFEAIDEPWKDIAPGLTERHWGVLDTDLKYKCSYNNKNFKIFKNYNNYYTLIPVVFPSLLLISCLIYYLLLKKKKNNYNKVSLNELTRLNIRI